LSKEAVYLYVGKWICRVTDVTATAKALESLVARGAMELAQAALPVERPYVISPELLIRL
jgi:hypothetical protein